MTLNGGTETTSAELQIEVIESQPDSGLNSFRSLSWIYKAQLSAHMFPVLCVYVGRPRLTSRLRIDLIGAIRLCRSTN